MGSISTSNWTIIMGIGYWTGDQALTASTVPYQCLTRIEAPNTGYYVDSSREGNSSHPGKAKESYSSPIVTEACGNLRCSVYFSLFVYSKGILHKAATIAIKSHTVIAYTFLTRRMYLTLLR